jgi:cytochrome c-type biogenesis protein
MVLLVVGVIVVGFIVWSIMSGSNQQTPAPTGSPSGGPTADSTPLPIGVAAPNFTLPGADGKSYSLSDYKGKVVLLEFFAPWCPHCQDDAPIFNGLAEKYKDNPNVQVLAISASPRGRDNESPITMDDITWFRDTYRVQFPMLLDKEMGTSGTYSIMFYPTVYIVDKEGKIAAQPAGYFVWENGKPISSREQVLNVETLSAQIDALLK